MRWLDFITVLSNWSWNLRSRLNNLHSIVASGESAFWILSFLRTSFVILEFDQFSFYCSNVVAISTVYLNLLNDNILSVFFYRLCFLIYVIQPLTALTRLITLDFTCMWSLFLVVCSLCGVLRNSGRNLIIWFLILYEISLTRSRHRFRRNNWLCPFLQIQRSTRINSLVLQQILIFTHVCLFPRRFCRSIVYLIATIIHYCFFLLPVAILVRRCQLCLILWLFLERRSTWRSFLEQLWYFAINLHLNLN